MKRLLQALDRDAERWLMRVFYSFCCIVIVHEVVRRFAFNFSSAWFEAALPIGFALIIFRSAQGIWRDVGDLCAGREVYAGKAMFDE